MRAVGQDGGRLTPRQSARLARTASLKERCERVAEQHLSLSPRSVASDGSAAGGGEGRTPPALSPIPAAVGEGSPSAFVAPDDTAVGELVEE